MSVPDTKHVTIADLVGRRTICLPKAKARACDCFFVDEKALCAIVVGQFWCLVQNLRRRRNKFAAMHKLTSRTLQLSKSWCPLLPWCSVVSNVWHNLSLFSVNHHT